MKINTEKLSTNVLHGKLEGFINKKRVMIHEIDGVDIEYISAKGPSEINENTGLDHYDVLLTFNGNAKLKVAGKQYFINGNSILKLPYNSNYVLIVEAGVEFNYLLIRKGLDEKDQHLISQNMGNHQTLYHQALSDCPTYKEEIKSDKTLNRMILPEGKVPRFCMGSVETLGPDEVAEHDHPMLDQLFFGLPSCQCNCHAGGDTTSLTENELLHIPLGSMHAVSVEEGNKLAYIWMDFFLTLEGEKYMDEQHQMDEE